MFLELCTNGTLCGEKSSSYTLLDNDIRMGILPQMLRPLDEQIIERQQWTPTQFKDHIKSSQDKLQEYQVNTTELSFDFHLPTITQQRINIPLVMHNDRTLKEYIQGEERCLKFINQDLTFLHTIYLHKCIPYFNFFERTGAY